MITAIAIDDEPKALDVVRHLTQKVVFLDLKSTFTDAFEAIDYLQKEKIDLIFLDIKMPDISGLDFLRSLTNPPMVIFTTAYSDHAVQSYDFDAVDYLLKPFDQIRFLKACNKAMDLLKLKQENQDKNLINSIFIKNGYEQVRVFFDDILYLEAGGNYVVFITQNQKIASRLTMVEAEVILPAELFVRIHRSYIVAKNKIQKFNRYEVVIHEKILPIGVNYSPIIQTPSAIPTAPIHLKIVS